MSEVEVNLLVAVTWLVMALVCAWQAVTWSAARPWLALLAVISLLRAADRILRARGYDGSAYGVLAVVTGVAVLLLAAWLIRASTANRNRDHSRLLLEHVYASVGDGIWVIDAEGRTAAVNPEGERLTGWRERDVLGKPSHDIIHHSHPDGSHYPIEECPIYRSLASGEVTHIVDEVFWRRDGSSFPVDYVTTPVTDSRGRRIGAVQVFRDATPMRDAAQQELRRQQAFEVNDLIVQRLVVADLALQLDRDEQATEAVHAALDAAKSLINEWAATRPDSLVRSQPAFPSDEVHDVL